MDPTAFIRWLMPKDDRFRTLLADGTRNLTSTARVLRELAAATTLEEMKLRGVELKDLEHVGDRITRQVFDALNATFVTPFDRDDLRALATDLDDVVDRIDEVGQLRVLFEMRDPVPGLPEFAEILVEMADEIDQATGALWDTAQSEATEASVVRISDLENRGDELYATLLADLFRTSSLDPIEVMKRKELYAGLENACDGCQDYSHAISNVLMKNS